LCLGLILLALCQVPHSVNVLSSARRAIWYRGTAQTRPHCVRCGRAPLPQSGTAPSFRPMSVVVKRLDGSRYHW